MCDVYCRSHFKCEKPIIALTCNPNTGSVAMEMDDGSVWRYKESAGPVRWQVEGAGDLVLPQCCPQVELGVFDKEEVVVGLSKNSKLYFSGREVRALAEYVDMYCAVEVYIYGTVCPLL